MNTVNVLADVGALCTMLGADGSASEGHVAGFGTGADGSGMYTSHAVRRFAGIDNTVVGSSIVRLPKAIAMFASRACRVSRVCCVCLLLVILLVQFLSDILLTTPQCFSCFLFKKSIMIGTALSGKEQRDILKKLVKTEVPWNCAHGRVCALL